MEPNKITSTRQIQAALPLYTVRATSTDAMVCWPDMIPTVIELADGTVPEDFD